MNVFVRTPAMEEMNGFEIVDVDGLFFGRDVQVKWLDWLKGHLRLTLEAASYKVYAMPVRAGSKKKSVWVYRSDATAERDFVNWPPATSQLLEITDKEAKDA